MSLRSKLLKKITQHFAKWLSFFCAASPYILCTSHQIHAPLQLFGQNVTFLTTFFLKEGMQKQGRRVVVGLVVRWKGEVLTHLLRGTAQIFIGGLDVALSEVKEHIHTLGYMNIVSSLSVAESSNKKTHCFKKYTENVLKKNKSFNERNKKKNKMVVSIKNGCYFPLKTKFFFFFEGNFLLIHLNPCYND